MNRGETLHPDIIICPACADAGVTSKVTDHGTSETLVAYMPFYDERGKRHHHDDNCRITHFACSNGHRFTYRPQRYCNCGWKGKEDCFCHPLGFKWAKGEAK